MNDKLIYEGQYGPDYEGQYEPVETVYGDGQFIENPDEMQFGFDPYGFSSDAEQMLLTTDQYGDCPNYIQLGDVDGELSGEPYGNENGLITPSGANFAPMSNLRAPNIRVPAANAIINRANFTASWDPVAGAAFYTVSLWRFMSNTGTFIPVFTGRQVTSTFTTILASQLAYDELHRIDVVARSGNQSSPAATRQFRVRINNVIALQSAISSVNIRQECNLFVNQVLNALASISRRPAGTFHIGLGNHNVAGMLNNLPSRNWVELPANGQEAWNRARQGIPVIAIAPLVSPVWRARDRIWRDSIQHVAILIPTATFRSFLDIRLANGGASSVQSRDIQLRDVWTEGSTGMHFYPSQTAPNRQLRQSRNPRAAIRFFAFTGAM